MIRRPPRSTRTNTLFPYTTLFRSDAQCWFSVLCARDERQFRSVLDCEIVVAGRWIERVGRTAWRVDYQVVIFPYDGEDDSILANFVISRMAIQYGRVQCGSLAALRRAPGPLVRPGGASDEFIDQRMPAVGVCPHDDSFVGTGLDNDVGAESQIPTGMIEVQSIHFTIPTNPNTHHVPPFGRTEERG